MSLLEFFTGHKQKIYIYIFSFFYINNLKKGQFCLEIYYTVLRQKMVVL
jgi:hypothetical protein